MKVVKKIGFLVKTDTYLNKPGLRTQVKYSSLISGKYTNIPECI